MSVSVKGAKVAGWLLIATVLVLILVVGTLVALILVMDGLALSFGQGSFRKLGAKVFVVILFSPVLLVFIDRFIVRFIIRPMRTMAEPLLVLLRVWPYEGINEATFRRRLPYWRDASIDSCVHALAILMHLNHREGVGGCRSTLDDFLKRNFIKIEGDKENKPQVRGFRQAVEAQPTIYASHMAIRLLKLLEGMSPPELYRTRFGAELATVLDNHGVEPAALTRFVVQCQDKRCGGFCDYPQGVYREEASMKTTHSACILLWNLNQLEPFKAQIRAFVLSCIKHQGQSGMGFADTPGTSPLTCSTYYALRILQKIDDTEWIKKNKDALARFLTSCWDDGGFRGSQSSRRTLVHTSLAVSALLGILKDRWLLSDARLEKLKAYIRSCEDRYGGFQFWDRAFGLGGRWYAANLYATYHVVGGVSLLKEFDPEFEQLLDWESIGSFVSNTAIKKENGCVWRGYSLGSTGFERAVAIASRKVLDHFLLPQDLSAVP